MNTVTLITGGIRCGKSRYALELARGEHAKKKVFIATAEPFDEDMRLRVEKHQKERGNEFKTVESPLYLSKAIKQAADEKANLILVDCLTLWMNNLFYHGKSSFFHKELEAFLEILKMKPTRIILVTNEVGFGIIPDNPLTRRYADELGRLNQDVARISDQVVLMIAGIAQKLKQASSPAEMD